MVCTVLLLCLQALARTSADVLSQLTEGRDTGLQLDSGLHLLLHLQLRFPNGMDNQTSQPCCLNSFINAKVSCLPLVHMVCRAAHSHLLLQLLYLLWAAGHISSDCCPPLQVHMLVVSANSNNALAQAKRAKNAIAQCLAEWRTQGPASPHAATAVPAMLVQVHPSVHRYTPLCTPLCALCDTPHKGHDRLLSCFVQTVYSLIC